MKSIVLSVLVSMALVSSAVENASDPDPAVRRISREEFQKLSGPQRKAYLDKLFKINHGGMVKKEGSGKGSIKIVMSIGDFDGKLLSEKLSAIDRYMKWPVSVVNGAPVSIANAKSAVTKNGANLCVFVVEEDGIPGLLSAPEEGWAIVNVKPLKAEKGSANTVNKRITKEIIRGLYLATGCWAAGGVMEPIRLIAELDLLSQYECPLTARPNLGRTIRAFGVEPRIEKSYKVACREGWAPAPTNEFQKAIWDKVHAIPKNPMKIEFDPKKGR